GSARDSARKQCFAPPRRADQQDAARNATAQLLESLGITQEFDNFLEVVLGLVNACHVFESDPPLRLGKQPGLGLAKAHRLSSGTLHLPGKNDPDRDKGDEGQRVDQDAHQQVHPFERRRGVDRSVPCTKYLDEVRIVGRVGRERPGVGEMAGYRIASDRDLAHMSLVNLIEQLTEGYVLRRYSRPGILKLHEKANNEQK